LNNNKKQPTSHHNREICTWQNVSIGFNDWQFLADITTNLSNEARKVKRKQFFRVNVLDCQLQYILPAATLNTKRLLR